jgi:hypothetical protein
MITVGITTFCALFIKGEAKRTFSVIGSIGIGLLLMAGAVYDSDRKTATQEVPMTQVPVSGEKDFTAQIKITYKDGKMFDIQLVKGTTKPLTYTVMTLPMVQP